MRFRNVSSSRAIAIGAALTVVGLGGCSSEPAASGTTTSAISGGDGGAVDETGTGPGEFVPTAAAPWSAPPPIDAGADAASDWGGGYPTSCVPGTTLSNVANETVVTLASRQSEPWALALDGTSVYWAAFLDGTIMKVALDGGPLTTLASGQPWAGGLAVDATSVYWSRIQDGSGGPLGVMKEPLAGGVPTLVATGFVNDNIVVGPTGVYGTNGGDSLLSAPLAGGGPATPLATRTGAGTSYGLAVDATRVYWTDFRDPGEVMSVGLDGSHPTVLATGHAGAGIAVDATSVYWIDDGSGSCNGSIMKVSLQGGAATVLATGLDSPTGLALDATSVYVTLGFAAGTAGAGSIVKVPINGGPLTTIADGLDQPAAIAVDATSVYWTTVAFDAMGAGSIMKATPK